MYILKNALISISRNKGRNILIASIILIIACACTITLAINNTANDLITSYESAYEKELTISFNRENMMKDFDMKDKDSVESAKEKFAEIESYTLSDIENFKDSSHILDYYYTYSISLDGSNIEKVTSEMDDSSSDSNKKGMPDNGMEMQESSYDFTLSGYSNMTSMSEFINGTYTMSEIADDAWDKAFSGNYVFINEELADYNDLSLGDTIKFVDDDGEKYSFEIIGIFTDNDTNDGEVRMFSGSANTVVTNAEVLANIVSENEEISYKVNPTFIIDDYENSSIIQDEFYEKGLSENYTVSTNEDTATSGLSSIENVKTFAKTFLIITLVIGGVVLLIINMINIRERKYEIGVFRTIGISKLKLTMQFLCELAIVAIVALLIGACLGGGLSKPVSNSLLESEISSSKETMEQSKNNFGGPDGGGKMDDIKVNGVVDIQAYQSIDAVVNFKVIIELLGIGLTLVLISSLASMICIERFSPLTILKERS